MRRAASWSPAGVEADRSGIDLALHIVEREYSAEIADTVEYTRDRDVWTAGTD